jgi:carboxymethylenebutenolidase
VIIVHEEWGLTDWVKSFSKQIAAEGYLVIVPDFLSGHKTEKDSLPIFVNENVIRTALLNSNTEQIMSDLDESFKYLKSHPSCNGKIAIIGFSWGGTQAFSYLAKNPGLTAGYIFYGTSPINKKDLSRIQSPVYGFYGEYDSRINSSIRNTEHKMHKLGKVFQSYIIDGGGHGFMRSGERLGATEDNIKARTAAWNKLMELLAGI